ncbi:glycerol-3-phosphate acyltransferase [Rossellomorea sp. AcN35-11]|nr:glycerol-3-phosphate acyltransferase [Rossellomorea aquimaris]WJV28767.1 glycerol-3-phosphate acyltransferase [Rossellomorea sp. AcN35-11]
MWSDMMMMCMIILISYGLGSITGAYYIVRIYTGEDIRNVGSGNVGATNAGRALGKKGFLLTLFIDAGKVMIALQIASLLNGDDRYLVLSSIFIMIGHLFPIQLGFHGGKGVVTYLATSLFFSAPSIGFFAITMGILYVILRKYTIAGFLSMASIPISGYLMGESFTISIGLSSLFVMVVLAHNRKFPHALDT